METESIEEYLANYELINRIYKRLDQLRGYFYRDCVLSALFGEEVAEKFISRNTSLKENKEILKELLKVTPEILHKKVTQYFRESINRALEEKGEEWVIASLVEGSCGYHTVRHAKRLIDDFKNGFETSGCERCLAIYNGDLLFMLWRDIDNFSKLPEERVKLVLQYVRAVKDLEDIKQIELGLMYPTMVHR